LASNLQAYDKKKSIPKFTKNTYFYPSCQPSRMGPSSISVAEVSDDPFIVDGYLFDLPAGIFNLKPTMGGYANRWLSLSSQIVTISTSGSLLHVREVEDAQALVLGPTSWRSMAGTRVRAHGFAFDGNFSHLHWCWGRVGSINPMLDFVWGLSTSCCPVQPYIGSIEHPLGRSTPLWAFQLCVWRFVVALGWPHTPMLVQGSW